MLIEQTKDELSAAQAIQGYCSLVSVDLERGDMVGHGKETDFVSPLKLNFVHKSSAVLEGQVLTIRPTFSFTSTDGSPEAKTVFQCSCTFRLEYQLQEAVHPTDIQIAAFEKGNAIYNCWPYVRELIQNLTSRMGFQPPPLPLLRVKVKKTAEVETPAPSD